MVIASKGREAVNKDEFITLTKGSIAWCPLSCKPGVCLDAVETQKVVVDLLNDHDRGSSQECKT
jgi:hypothetical protein